MRPTTRRRPTPLFSCGALLLLALLAGCTDKPGSDGGTAPPVAGALHQTPPATCGSCHEQHYAEWSRSMHAYAGRDPVWFALNELAELDTGGAIDTFCLDCHVPGALLGGKSGPVDPENAPPEFDRGIDCAFCHTVDRFHGISNAQMTFEHATDNTVFGTMRDPVANDFHQSERRSAMHSSSFCGTCHEVENTLGTVIERTYTEWLDSAYTAMSIECNDCHMPTYRGTAAAGAPERTLHRHTFTGVDVAMEDVPYRQQQIDETLALLRSTATLSLSGTVTGAKAELEAVIHNLGAGHAFPSGATMERQAWIELIVEDAGGQVLYETGTLDANGDLRDQHSALTPNSDPDLALFHSRMLDANGAPTELMWRAAAMEDNLIPTFGSRTATYTVTLPPGTGPVTVLARLLFRALPPYLLRELGRADLVEWLPIFEVDNATLTLQ